MADKPKVIVKQDRAGNWRNGAGQYVKPPIKNVIIKTEK